MGQERCVKVPANYLKSPLYLDHLDSPAKEIVKIHFRILEGRGKRTWLNIKKVEKATFILTRVFLCTIPKVTLSYLPF